MSCKKWLDFFTITKGFDLKFILPFLTGIFILTYPSSVLAKTIYAGKDGNQLCNGSADVPFSVSNNVNCRTDSPSRFPLNNGDALVINGGAYNISSPIIVASNSTITGKNGVKLVGVDRASSVLSVVGVSNATIDGLNISDGSECQETGPNPCNRDTPPYGPWSQNGIYMVDATNILIKNSVIHGMAYRGIWWGRVKDVTLQDVSILNNSFAGIDGDLHGNSSNGGTITFTRVTIKGSGCGERLNGTRYNCYSQSQTPTGFGDQIGEAATSGKYVYNDCDISEGVSDGIDNLYHKADDDVIINGGTMQNNAGNSVKSGGRNTTITGTTIGGDCNYFKKHPEYVWKMNGDSSSYGFDHCRAKGDNLAVTLNAGGKVTINKVIFASVTNFAILSAGSSCNGSEKVIVDQNSRFQLLPGARAYYASGLPDGNGAGPCGKIQATCLQPDGSARDCNDLNDPKLIQYSSITIPPVDTTPPTILNLDATPKDTSAIIVWELSENATGQVEYGLTATYGLVSIPELSFAYARHVQTLSALAKATTYHYRVKSKDQAGNQVVSEDKTFTTTGTTVCVPDHSCDTVACGKTCVDNCGTIIAGKPCPMGSCQMTVPVACDQVRLQ